MIQTEAIDGVSMLSIIAEAAEKISLVESLSAECHSTPNPHLEAVGSATGIGTTSNDIDGYYPTCSHLPNVKSDSSCSSSSSSNHPKLVLPELTLDVQEDLEARRGSRSDVPLSISKRPEWVNYQLKNIMEPHPNDVLCGRGGGSNNHAGNESFRLLVNEVKLPYVNCSKREKPLIARRIVEAVRNQTPPGRFLQKDGVTGFWDDIGDSKAREKTSQALREGAPVLRDMIGKPIISDMATVVAPVKIEDVAEVLRKKKSERSIRSPSKQDSAEEKMKVIMENDAFKENKEEMLDHALHQANGSLPTSYSFLKGEPAINKNSSIGGSSYQSLSSLSSQINESKEKPSFHSFKRIFQHDQHDTFSSMNPHHPTLWHQPFQNEFHSYHPPPPSRMLGEGAGGYLLPQSMHIPHQQRRATIDYPPPQMRQPATDSVPLDTVRKLLLGQVDPVQLALQILCPEDAAMVAIRHFTAETSLGMRASHTVDGNVQVSNGIQDSRPSPQRNLVSDGSSTSIDSQTCKSETSRSLSAGDDPSSDDSWKWINTERTKSSLPRKKRKFVEALDI